MDIIATNFPDATGANGEAYMLQYLSNRRTFTNYSSMSAGGKTIEARKISCSTESFYTPLIEYLSDRLTTSTLRYDSGTILSDGGPESNSEDLEGEVED